MLTSVLEPLVPEVVNRVLQRCLHLSLCVLDGFRLVIECDKRVHGFCDSRLILLNVIMGRLNYVLLHAENKLLPRILVAAKHLSLTLKLFLQFQLLFQVLLVTVCAVFQFPL